MSEPRDPGVNERIRRNIESVAQLEKAFERGRTAADRVSDAVAAFGGSVRFIAVNIAAVACWVLWNLLASPTLRFDPSLGVLQLVLAGEALCLSSFVLMSQNRQNRQADHWAHVGLQVSLLAEQEATKMLQMMQALCQFVGMEKGSGDRDLKQLTQDVPVSTLAQEVGKSLAPDLAAVREIAAVLEEEDRAEKETAGPEGGAGP